MEIKDFIPMGHENAVRMDTLMAMTGLGNRQVRKMISESDAIILNLQDGKGYFRMNPRTKAERAFAQKYSAQEKSRGWSVLKKAFRVDNKLKATEPNEFNGNLYRMARLLAGYTQDEIADLLDVSPILVDMVEDGTHQPDDWYKSEFEEIVGLEI